MSLVSPRSAPRVLGRYLLFEEIAAGGMATIHLARLVGPVGFSRTVAIKRLHPQFAKDPEFASAFLDEARLAARIQHPNVVSVLDVVAQHGELFLVMDYVHGQPLSKLRRTAAMQGEVVPPRIAAAILVQALHGLHAAHEACGTDGTSLGIVHRDVSPQNVLVGAEGITRITDFGVAKAIGRAQTTKDGSIKGKLAYMSPEQLRGEVDRRTDVFAAAIVLWEALTGQPLFGGGAEGEVLFAVVEKPVLPPSTFSPGISRDLDAVVLCGLERDPARRFQSARDMAVALERCISLATASEIGAFVERLEGHGLAQRAAWVRELESSSVVMGSDSSKADGGFAAVEQGSDRSARRPDLVAEQSGRTQGSLSVGRATADGSGRRAWPWGIAGLSVAALLSVVGWVVRQPRAATGVQEVSAASAPAVAPAVSSISAAETPATPSSSASANVVLVTPSLEPSAVLKAPAPQRTIGKPQAPKSASCDPPFVLDQNGAKRWKPECFGSQ